MHLNLHDWKKSAEVFCGQYRILKPLGVNGGDVLVKFSLLLPHRLSLYFSGLLRRNKTLPAEKRRRRRSRGTEDFRSGSAARPSGSVTPTHTHRQRGEDQCIVSTVSSQDRGLGGEERRVGKVAPGGRPKNLSFTHT